MNALWLLALPFFRFGPNNDLVMRGSIAALTIIAFVFGLVLVELWRTNVVGAAIGWSLVAVATPSAALGVWRALATRRDAISC